jgi:hypothetical protein
MILIAYRHGLRAAEIADLEASQVELGRNAAQAIEITHVGLGQRDPLHERCGVVIDGLLRGGLMLASVPW